jgi:acetyl esterase
MPKLDPGIVKYLQRINEETAGFKAPRNIEEQRWNTERRHAVWRKAAPDHIQTLNWWIGLPGREIPIRIYRRNDIGGKAPVILYFHGGGFVASSYDTHDAITWGIADETHAAVISVNYRRAPENPYPAATSDSYEVLNWVVANQDWLGLDSERLLVAGDSAGGCLAAVLARTAMEKSGPPIRMQALLYPCLDTRFDRDSMRKNQDPMLTSEMMAQFWSLYLAGDMQINDPRAVPMRARNYAGLPPAYVVVGEYDPLHDEVHEYAERLRQGNVQTEFRSVAGCIHGFFRARFVSEVADAEFKRLCRALRQALN